MIADVSYDIGHEELTVREDADGEARVLGAELALELEIKLLSKENAQVLADIYGVSCEVDTITSAGLMKKLRQDMYLEEKFAHNTKLEEAQPKPLQICHSDAKLEMEDCAVSEDEITWKGTAALRLMYQTGEEGSGFYTLEDSVPFAITRPAAGLDGGQERQTTQPQLTQLHAALKDGNQIEWRGVIQLHMPLYDVEKSELLQDIHVGELDSQKLEKLPGFAIYFVKREIRCGRLARNTMSA